MNQQEKECIFCSNIFTKNVNYSDKQWDIALYCSRKCFAYVRKNIPRSEETKRKLSKAHKGTKKPWAGKYKHTEEHNERIRLGVKLAYEENGDEMRRKISEANLGRVKSPEEIKKLKEAQKKRPTYRGGEKTRKKRKCFYEKRRNVRKFENGGNHTLQEWEDLKIEYSFTCPCCLKKEPEIKLTEDHIIPLTKKGTDDINNIQPLCFSCNSKKRTKIIKYGIPTQKIN